LRFLDVQSSVNVRSLEEVVMVVRVVEIGTEIEDATEAVTKNMAEAVEAVVETDTAAATVVTADVTAAEIEDAESNARRSVKTEGLRVNNES